MSAAPIPRKSPEIVLDFDTTDDPLHGAQEGAFFHGYYRNYCYLPLYCFCGTIPLMAKLRDAAQTLQDRREGEDLLPAHPLGVGERISLPGNLPAGVGQLVGDACGLRLTAKTSPNNAGRDRP